MKKVLATLAFIMLPVTGAFAQTASQSVIGFLLDPGATYGSYTCPATNVGPCFVQYGDTLPTSGGGGGGSDVNITEVGGNAVTTTVPVSGSIGLTGALPAGSAIIGNVGIDQTTDGTTNGVVSKVGSTTIATPTNAAVTVTSVSVGTASAQALAASSATVYLFIQNVSTTANVACNFGATAALNTAGSFMLVPNQSRTFEGSFVPTTVLNCIASAAATPVTIESH